MGRARKLADLLNASGDVRSESLDNEISLGDGVKAQFGNSNDLQIYHDGGNSRIQDTGTGNLIIRASAGTYIQGVNGENGVVVLENGAVSLWYDNSQKLVTTATGANVGGNLTLTGTVDGRDVATDGTKLDGIEAGADVTDTTNVSSAGAVMTTGGTMTGNLKFNDGLSATFGTGNDLEIYHNGSNSYIKDGGTGIMFIQGAAQVQIEGATANENMAVFTENGSCQLMYDNATKIETTSTGINVTGEVKGDTLAIDGTNGSVTITSGGNDMFFSRNANNYIHANGGTSSNLVLNPDNRLLVNTAGVERIRVDSNGNVGIGTSSPIYKLDVNGSGRFGGNLTMDNNWIYMQYSGHDLLRFNAYSEGFDFYNQTDSKFANIRAGNIALTGSVDCLNIGHTVYNVGTVTGFVNGTFKDLCLLDDASTNPGGYQQTLLISVQWSVGRTDAGSTKYWPGRFSGIYGSESSSSTYNATQAFPLVMSGSMHHTAAGFPEFQLDSDASDGSYGKVKLQMKVGFDGYMDDIKVVVKRLL